MDCSADPGGRGTGLVRSQHATRRGGSGRCGVGNARHLHGAVGAACGEANFSGAVLIVVFTGAYFAVRALCAPFTGRR